jgi:hypothetical protein
MNKNFNMTRAAMMLLLAVLTATVAWAQGTTVYIPSEELVNYGSSSHPTSTYYSYSLTQQLYTAAEIGQAGKVTSIAFYNMNSGTPRELDIYLKHTTKESFSDKYDWTAMTAADLVFSGTVTLAKGKWTVIDLDTPFDYNGTSNLLLTVDDNTDNEGAQYGNNTWCTAFAASNQAIAISNNYKTNMDNPVNFDPMNPPTEDIVVGTETLKPGVYYRKNQIALCFEGNVKPYKLAVADITDMEALVSWSPRGGEAKWNLRYKEADAADWTVVNGQESRSYTLTGLNPGTKYEVQVQAVVGEETSDWTASVTFLTMNCDAASTTEVIYAFMDRDGNGWGEQAIRVKEHDTGLEVAYLRMLKGELDGGHLTLCCGKDYDLEWIRDEDDYAGYAQCAFAFYYENGDEIISKTYDDYTELKESHLLTTFTADCTAYDFKMPTTLTVYDENYQGVTLSWKSTDATTWQVSYTTDADADPENGTIVDADTNPFVLNGLEANTTYYFAVRSVELEEGGAAPAINGPQYAKKAKKKSRWTMKLKCSTHKSKARPRSPKAKIRKRNKVLVELLKARGSEKNNNLLYSLLSKQRKAVIMDNVIVRKLEENGYLNKSENDIWSENHEGGKFDNVVLIPAKKGSQLTAKVVQMKTGAKSNEPYSTGWIPKKELSGDPANEEVVTKEELTKALNAKQRYKVEAYTTTNEEAAAMEANDDSDAEQPAEAPALRSGSRRDPEADDGDGYLFIRHNETVGGVLVLMDLEIVEPEDVTEWTKVSLGEGVMEHLLEGLTPEDVYLAKVEPVYDDETTGLMSPIAVFTPHDAVYLFDDEDNTATLTAANGQTDNVVLSGRTFYMDQRWNTLCLPFDMTAEQIANSPLSETIIMGMHDAVVEGESLKVTFWQVQSIEAGKAYIFQYPYWDENITDPFFPNVTISKTAAESYADVNNIITYHGTFAPFALTANNQQQLYLKSNLLWYPTAAINVNAFRGYFELASPLSASKFELVFEEGTTGFRPIDNISSAKSKENDQWYSVDGRRLNAKPTTKGIYINNGRKVVMR